MTAAMVESDGQAAMDDERRQLSDDITALRSTYGPRWTLVPVGHSARARVARETLATGLVRIDPDVADPVRLPQELGPFAQETADAASLVLAEASYLGEALGADLSGFALRDLRQLSRAILQLSDAPPPNPTWASPSSAHAASIVLSTLGQDVRAARALHTELYNELTEAVWDLESVKRLPNKSWRRPMQRRRLRADLASVSRSGRPVTNLKASLIRLRHAVQLRSQIDETCSALTAHLGWFATGGIPDVDGAAQSLAAMQRLQSVLGDHLDRNRLHDLGASDAFVSEELTVPALAVLSTIDAWAAHARQLAGPDPLRSTPLELSRWAAEATNSLAVVVELRDATAPLRSSARMVGQILDDAIIRDRLDAMCQDDDNDDNNQNDAAMRETGAA
jgi:hypothetical protein